MPVLCVHKYYTVTSVMTVSHDCLLCSSCRTKVCQSARLHVFHFHHTCLHAWPPAPLWCGCGQPCCWRQPCCWLALRPSFPLAFIHPWPLHQLPVPLGPPPQRGEHCGRARGGGGGGGGTMGGHCCQRSSSRDCCNPRFCWFKILFNLRYSLCQHFNSLFS